MTLKTSAYLEATQFPTFSFFFILILILFLEYFGVKTFLMLEHHCRNMGKRAYNFDKIEGYHSLGTARLGRAKSARAGAQASLSWENFTTQKTTKEEIPPERSGEILPVGRASISSREKIRNAKK